MAESNISNRFDFKCDGKSVFKGTHFTANQDLAQPEQEQKEKKEFDGSSLTGKVIGAVVAAGCVAAAFGLVAAWGVSAFFSGGATAAAAPLVMQCAVFLLAAAPIAMGAGKAISEQYNKDMENKEDSGYGAYAKVGIVDPVVVGAQDFVIGVATGYALVGLGKIGGRLLRRMFRPMHRIRVVRQTETPAAKYADSFRGFSGKKCPNTVAVVKTKEGNFYYGRNKGEHINSSIDDLIEDVGMNKYNGKCAEMDALRSAKSDGANLKDAEISVAHVKRNGHDPKNLHGTYKEPCSTCSSVIDRLGVIVMEGK